MLFDTPEGKTQYVARLARDTAGVSAAAAFPPESAAVRRNRENSAQKQWNVFVRAPLSFQTDGWRQLKAKPKTLLAVKVMGRSMAPPLFNGDADVIGRSETRKPTAGDVFAPVCSGEILAKCLFTLPDGLCAQSNKPFDGSMFERLGERTEAVQLIGRVRH
jgi:phage repressor protein C with HTH and peptisase S24 domain